MEELIKIQSQIRDLRHRQGHLLEKLNIEETDPVRKSDIGYRISKIFGFRINRR